MLRAGIVGLPNVGKTTFFNAVTAQSSALISNYPFASSKANVGVVAVPDERLGPLAKLVKTSVIVPASVEFVDIAGLVRGSSKGEGLGNQFLASIRETDTMIQVVRCFEDENIVHVDGVIDARRDIETIQIEPALEEFQPAKSVSLSEDERAIARNYFLLTMKPTIYAANVNETTLTAPNDNEHVRVINEVAALRPERFQIL